MPTARLTAPKRRVNLGVWFSDRSSVELPVRFRRLAGEEILPAKRTAAQPTFAGCSNGSQTPTAAASPAVSSQLLREAASHKIRAASRYIRNLPLPLQTPTPKSPQPPLAPLCG